MSRDFYIPNLEAYISPFVLDELMEQQVAHVAPAPVVKPTTVSFPPPDTIVQELAVLPFSTFDRKAFYGDFLPLKKNSEATAKINKIFSGYGINYATFITQLEKFVDLSLVESTLKKLYPAKTFSRSAATFDEIVTEGIHQFQLKCSNTNDVKYFDGILSSHTLDNLGFVFHLNRRPVYTPASSIEKALKAADVTKAIETYSKSIPVAALQNVTGSNWFSYRCNPVIFGRKGTHGYGFSVFLVLELRKAESQLCQLYDKQLVSLFTTKILPFNTSNDEINVSAKLMSSWILPGMVPSLLGDVLEIDEDHGDIRYPDKPSSTSMHLTGLAIDIKYTSNPWVRFTNGFGDMKRSSPALITEKDLTAQQYFFSLAKKLNTNDLYDFLSVLSRNYASYFKKIYKGKNPNFNYLQIEHNGYRDPAKGFLHLNKDLVLILRDQLFLAWGPADFGRGTFGNGDMMHFDMRTSDIGRAYRKQIGQSVEDTLNQVHPKFKHSAGTTPETENQLPAEASDSWFAKLQENLSAFSFWAIKGTPLMIYLISLYQKGEKDPVNLTNKLFYDVLYPERKGSQIKVGEKAIYQKRWNALFNFLVTPFLLLSGRAVKTHACNLLIPNAGNIPLLFVKNEYGLVLFPLSGLGFARYTKNMDDIYTHPITHVKGKHGDNWIDPQTGADFYNAIQDFRATSEGQDVIIHYGDVSAYDPAVNLGHKSHNHGKSIDIHYFGSKGEELSGTDAYLHGDVTKVNVFFCAAEKYSFVNNYSYGKRFTHSGNNNQIEHKDHFHIGQAIKEDNFINNYDDERFNPDQFQSDNSALNFDTHVEYQTAPALGLTEEQKIADLKNTGTIDFNSKVAYLNYLDGLSFYDSLLSLFTLSNINTPPMLGFNTILDLMDRGATSTGTTDKALAALRTSALNALDRRGALKKLQIIYDDDLPTVLTSTEISDTAKFFADQMESNRITIQHAYNPIVHQHKLSRPGGAPVTDGHGRIREVGDPFSLSSFPQVPDAKINARNIIENCLSYGVLNKKRVAYMLTTANDESNFLPIMEGNRDRHFNYNRNNAIYYYHEAHGKASYNSTSHGQTQLSDYLINVLEGAGFIVVTDRLNRHFNIGGHIDVANFNNLVTILTATISVRLRGGAWNDRVLDLANTRHLFGDMEAILDDGGSRIITDIILMNADFYRYAGKGIIQTTWRDTYNRLMVNIGKDIPGFGIGADLAAHRDHDFVAHPESLLDLLVSIYSIVLGMKNGTYGDGISINRHLVDNSNNSWV